MIKFYKARSRLYRRQILQVNIRWKALDEIYKIYIILQRSDLKISAKKMRPRCSLLQNGFQKIVFQLILQCVCLILIIIYYNSIGVSLQFSDNGKDHGDKSFVE